MLSNINNINNEEVLLNNPIAQQSKVAGVDKKAVSQNPYLKTSEFADVIEISDKAKELYEKELEIEKYKAMVMEDMNVPEEPEQINSILESIKSGSYISNDELAEKMLKGDLSLNANELLQILLSNPEMEINQNMDILGTDT